nr:Rv3235 family protein [Saccharothrix obliqua]
MASRLLVAVLEVVDGHRPRAQLVPVLARSVVAGGRTGRLARVRACPVSGGIAELAGVLTTAGGIRAVVARVERRDGRWQCTVFELLP